MKIPVMLTICGKQYYADQEPETIELTTEGTMEKTPNGWDICYMETDLTGLAGVHTSFLVEPERIVLTRSGKLTSQMVFVQGQSHDSLYQMEFGALMITVNATAISSRLTQTGGVVDLSYTIEIEQTAAGKIEYHLEIKKL
jgi:uncharacterized beta-barrel protein YwiB (DUF1934 family)